ncbi:MAG: GNAT family N-acetyltransferase [Dermatophilaceae bacterium]
MRITTLDLADADEVGAAYAVLVASRSVDRPTFVAPGQADLVADWRHEDPGEEQVLRVARLDGRVVGMCSAWYPLGDNLDKVWADVNVDPPIRRRGVGTALVHDLLAQARSRGRSRVVVEAACPVTGPADHPCGPFAQRQGFRMGVTETTRRLVLPVPAARLAELGEHARQRYAGRYAVATYDEVPEHLVGPLCRLGNLVGSQAPSGEIEWETESMTPQRYQGLRALDREQGRVRLTALATEVATGEAVAYSELMLRPGLTRVEQWGTLVDEAHRGHRLGLAVKVANLQTLQDRFPDRRDVTTSNAVENPWMIAINEDLGFRPVELLVGYVRDR